MTGEVDELGFAHFTSAPSSAVAADDEGPDLARGWAELWVQIAAAVRRDFDSIGSGPRPTP